MARRADSSAHSRDLFDARGRGRQDAMAAGLTITDDSTDDGAIESPDVSRELSAGRQEKVAAKTVKIKRGYRTLVSWLLSISGEDSLSVNIKTGRSRTSFIVKSADIDSIPDGTTAPSILASVEQHEETEYNPDVTRLITSFRGLHQRRYEILVDLELDAHARFQGGLIDKA